MQYVMHWTKLLGEALEYLSLQILKAWLIVILTNLVKKMTSALKLAIL